jgi:hypothetical protein
MRVAIVSLAFAAMMCCGAAATADDASMSMMPGKQMMMKQCMSDQKAMNNSMSMSDMKKACNDKMMKMQH